MTLAGAGAGQSDLDNISFGQILELSCYWYVNIICGIYLTALCFLLLLEGINKCSFNLHLLIYLHIIFTCI